MKHYVCILVIALVHRATCFPVGDPLASVSPSVPSFTPEMKGPGELKSDAPNTPIVAGVLPDKAADFVAPPAAPPKDVTGGEQPVSSPSSPAPAATVPKEVSPAVVHDAAPKASSPVAADEPSTAIKESVAKSSSNTEAVKMGDMAQTAEIPVERSDKIAVEQVAVSSEQPKEANSQVNSVSVDEPKPVRNEVKSEIPKEEKVMMEEQIKVEKIKDEVKSEKVGDAVKEEVKGVVADQAKGEKVVDEVKSEKVETVKNVMVTSSGEIKHDEAKGVVSSEESVRKGDASGSEEKNASVERVVASDERKESEEKNGSAEEKRESSSSSSEETKEDMPASPKPTEKPIEEPKKDEKKEEKKSEEKKEEKKEMVVVKDEKKELREESSVKPIVDAQVIESAKPSTVAIVAASTGPQALVDSATEKVDVIKREAAKDNKHDEKKSTEIVKKDKLQMKGGSSAQKDDEIKSSKGQDKIVN